MDYILKETLFDTSIFIILILFLFFTFRFLSQNLRDKAKYLTFYSIIGIIAHQLLSYLGLISSPLVSKIFLLIILIIPIIVLLVLIATSLFTASGQKKIISLFKNRFIFGLLALISAGMKLLLITLSALLNLFAFSKPATKLAPGPESPGEDIWRHNNIPGATGYYDDNGKYRKSDEGIFDE